jgi:hypothetical protein
VSERGTDGARPGREALRASLARTPTCIPLERLGEPLTEHEREHVQECARCQTELALREEFEQSTPAAEDGAAVAWVTAELRRRRTVRTSAPLSEVRRWFASPRTLAAVAGIVLVVAVGYLAWDREPGVRDVGPAPIYRSSSVNVIAPVGDVTVPPHEMTWQPVSEAAAYEIVLREVDRTVLWQATSAVPRASVPAAVERRFVPGKTILWDVTARDGSGVVLAQSGSASFRVVPTSPPRKD